ncbi:MAG: SPASM domain-containing protein, partial [Spirochaetota bacterium]
MAKAEAGTNKVAAYEMSVIENHRDYLHSLDEDFVRYMTPKRANCGMGTRTWVMDPAGSIRPCALMPRGFLELGNVFEGDVDAIAQHRALHALGRVRAPVYTDTGCSACEHRVGCSMCFFRAVLFSESGCRCLWRRSPEVRESARMSVVRMVCPETGGY